MKELKKYIVSVDEDGVFHICENDKVVDSVKELAALEILISRQKERAVKKQTRNEMILKLINGEQL